MVFRSRRPDIRGEVDVVVVQRDAMPHGVALGWHWNVWWVAMTGCK